MKFYKKPGNIYFRTNGLETMRVINYRSYVSIEAQSLSSDKSVRMFAKSFKQEITEEEFNAAYYEAMAKLEGRAVSTVKS